MSGNSKKCAGKEGFQRMNYLYQAANMLATENESKHVAAIHYINLMQNISKKTVQRLDIDTKRTICKGCKSLLLAGVNCKVRLKKKGFIGHAVYVDEQKHLRPRIETIVHGNRILIASYKSLTWPVISIFSNLGFKVY